MKSVSKLQLGPPLCSVASFPGARNVSQRSSVDDDLFLSKRKWVFPIFRLLWTVIYSMWVFLFFCRYRLLRSTEYNIQMSHGNFWCCCFTVFLVKTCCYFTHIMILGFCLWRSEANLRRKWLTVNWKGNHSLFLSRVQRRFR